MTNGALLLNDGKVMSRRLSCPGIHCPFFPGFSSACAASCCAETLHRQQFFNIFCKPAYTQLQPTLESNALTLGICHSNVILPYSDVGPCMDGCAR